MLAKNPVENIVPFKSRGYLEASYPLLENRHCKEIHKIVHFI